MVTYVEEYIMYLRKSRSDGEKVEAKKILERHEKTLQDYAVNALGFKIEEKNIYREVVSGGENIEARPAFMQVLKRLEVGNVKGVLVMDAQRLSRSGLYGAGTVLEIFQVTDTLIVTPLKTYNLNDKIDKKYLEMVMIQSAEYLDYTKEVLGRGRKASIVDGKYIGSTPPYGYNKHKLEDEKGYKLVIDTEEAEVVKNMFDLILEGLGTSNIANYLNKENIAPKKAEAWTPQMVYNIVTNPTYYGMLSWERRKEVKVIIDGKITKSRPLNEEYILVKGLHTPIISKEVYDTVQEKLKNNAPACTPGTEIKNTLAGVVVCGLCGHVMVRRPYTKSFKKHEVRKYELDKEALLKLLRQHKEVSGLSLTSLANKLDVTKDVVVSWFPAKLEKFYPSKKFSAKWYELKKLLNIKTTKYDKTITTYVTPPIQEDTLICSAPYCKNVSSKLSLVEKAILDALKDNLRGFNYYLDNYATEVEKSVKSNLQALQILEKKEEKLNKQLKNAKKFYELEDYTRAEYLERKQEILIELEELENKRKTLESAKEEDKIIKYRKAVPKLKKCIEVYPSLDIKDKNALLRSIIDKVAYTKTNTGGRWSKEAEKDFTLDIVLKL